MESYLNENFGAANLPHSPDEALQRWRKLRETVKIPKRRFRFVFNRTKRCYEAIVTLVRRISQVSSQDKPTNFPISADELASMVETRDSAKMEILGGAAGVAEKLSTTLAGGIAAADAAALARRRVTFGANKFGGARIFWGLVFKNLKGVTLIVLGLNAILSLFLGLITEGWPGGAIHGISTAFGVLFSSLVTATVDYKCPLVNLAVGEGRLMAQVTRSGSQERVSRGNLVVGDIVHLSVGDRAPADGVFISGSDGRCPFIHRGAEIEEGPCAMMVAAVGMRTVWAKNLAAKLGEGEESDEGDTLQLRVNRVAIVIGKMCIFSEVVTLAILADGFFRSGFREGNWWSWSGDDAVEFMEIFALAITGKSKSGRHELKGFIRSQVCKYAFSPS